ncbi:MAG: leucine-rich repeat domain-containing protein [Muribaculaceae bacterium]|nr:leucine-rich repeat domain-containing protein [Muribaculaceae bacterium]
MTILAAPSLGAETVTSEPGALSRQLQERSVTSLTVTGEIDIRDMQFIVDSLPELTSLDLSGARVAGYAGDRLYAPASADILPAYSLMGLRAGKVTLPAQLKRIDDGALAATAITAITLPAGVTAVGTGAFAGSAELASVALPASLKAIGTAAFKDCTSLTAIDLPEAVTAIDSCAFDGCRALSVVNFPASLTRIGARAFQGTALTDISLQGCKSLRRVGAFAFAHIPTLTSAILPAGASQLGEGLFFDCESLQSVVMPEAIDELPDYVLKGTQLTDHSGVIPSGVTRIGRYALYGNARIVALELPEGLESIDDRALAGLVALKRLDAARLSSLPALGDDVFAGTASKDVALLSADDMAPIFEVADQWKEFTVIAYSSADEVEADSPMSRLLLRYDGSDIYITAGRPISAVDIYDLSGSMIAARRLSAPEAETSVSVGPRAGQVVILRVAYADTDSTSIAKLKL